MDSSKIILNSGKTYRVKESAHEASARLSTMAFPSFQSGSSTVYINSAHVLAIEEVWETARGKVR